jgi:SAM-dependent methyltransferase
MNTKAANRVARTAGINPGPNKFRRSEKLSALIDIYKAPDFSMTRFAPGATLLVVGCCEGELLRELAASGHQVAGTDRDPDYVAALVQEGHAVQQAGAEELPFAAESVDGIVSSGMLSGSDERNAIAEWHRVLKPGGVVLLSCQGFGHGLLCLMTATDWRTRVYGARMVINTWVYRLTGRRLPGFLGNALCQSESRLASYYAAFGFRVVQRYVSSNLYMGQPVFIYQKLEKTGLA